MADETVGPVKSCLTCPSYLRPEEVPSKFRKSIGSPMCGRWGYILGKPGLKKVQEDKLAKYFASKCGTHGDPLPPIPTENPKFEVTLPDPDARSRSINLDDQERCTACSMCRNKVDDETVAKELGWAAGLCAAKGRIILPTRQSYEARGCEYREFGSVRHTTAGLHLLPIYEETFAVNSDPIRAYFKHKDEFVDPTVYPTDRIVSEKDAESGVRAWRKIIDPDGSGNEVFLPIYRRDHFTLEQVVKIPKTGSEEHPELYIDHNGAVYSIAAMWTELDETPALWGQAGVGKTELLRHMAWLMQLPFERISITASTELDDLVGKMHFSKEKGTYFQYGRLPKAWISPCVICLDEPNTGQPDVWQLLRPLTDNSKQLVVDQNNNEWLERHTDCYLGMAMNPAWDPKNVGAEPISDADGNRLMHIFMELPPPVLEREIIKNRVSLDGWEISDSLLNTIMSIAEEIRSLCNLGTLPITWAIRPQLKVARASRWFDLLTAYRRAIGDSLEPEAQEVLLDAVRRHVGEE